MNLIGNKDTFAVGLDKGTTSYQLSLYVKGNDILKYMKDGILYDYRWVDCQDIIDWFQENINNILYDDQFPLSIIANSAAEKCALSYKLDFDEIEKYEELQDWMFRHSWFSARAGSYLADVFFVKQGNIVEVSWDNTETFSEDGIKFVFPKGRYEVDILVFERMVDKLCSLYVKL